jgi:predicted ester cyclase
MYDAWNANDLQRVEGYAQPDCRVTNVAFGTTMPFKDYERNWATAFPDGKVEPVHIASDGDCVIAEFIGKGTHRGPLQGPSGTLPPTNRSVEGRFIEIWEFRNGKIAAGRMVFDSAGFMAQLGVTPQMGAATGAAAQARPQQRS